MSGVGLSRPRLALPFTVVVDGDTVHLIAGEDMRYSVRAGVIAEQIADLLRECDGQQSLDSLLDRLSDDHTVVAKELIERLAGERIILEGPVESFHVADRYAAVVKGEGPLVDRLASENSGGKPIAVLCQDTLDYRSALEFNRRCLHGGDAPWLWITTGPASRGYVSPVFLPDAGPCLGCLLRHFWRLSPVPQLYDALSDHGAGGGDFAAAPFSNEALTVLEQIARWKIGQLSEKMATNALFQLHVLEVETMQVSLHRVFLDPTCPDCHDARLV